MKNSKLFQSLSKLSVAAIAGFSVAALPSAVFADNHEGEETEESGDKGCSGEKGCGGDKGCGGESDSDEGAEAGADKEGDKGCSGHDH